MSKFILNVGGTIFTTTVKNIKKIKALRSIISDNGDFLDQKDLPDYIGIDESEDCWLFIDRDPDEFKKILNEIRISGRENSIYLSKTNYKLKYIDAVQKGPDLIYYDGMNKIIKVPEIIKDNNYNNCFLVVDDYHNDDCLFKKIYKLLPNGQNIGKIIFDEKKGYELYDIIFKEKSTGTEVCCLMFKKEKLEKILSLLAVNIGDLTLN